MATGEVIPPPPWEKKDQVPPAPWEQQGFPKPKGEVSKKAQKHLGAIRSEQAIAGAAQDESNLYAKGAGEIAAAIPFAFAAPFTAGATLAGGLAAMGGAGVAGGLLRETVKAKAGSSQIPQTKKDLAISLGIDGAAGVFSEGAGRAIGEVGHTLLPKLMQRYAGQSAKGAELLKNASAEVENSLHDLIDKAAPPIQGGQILSNVEAPFKRAYDALAKIASRGKGGGAVVGRHTGLTQNASEMIQNLEKDLLTKNGSIASHQPLKGIVSAKGSIQQQAFTDEGLKWQEQQIFKRLASDLDGIIKTDLNRVSDEAGELYKKFNDLQITKTARTGTLKLAEQGLQGILKITARNPLGAALGAYEGYKKGGGAGGAAGAIVGAAVQNELPNAAAWALQKVWASPAARTVYDRALDAFLTGTKGKATELAGRAFAMAGVREPILNYIKKLSQ